MELLILLGILACAYAMVAAKRVSALIANFRLQSFLLFLLTLIEAYKGQAAGLYVTAFLILLIKVIGIPYFFFRLLREIKVNENLGFFINPQLSLFLCLVFTYLAWVFAGVVFVSADTLFRVSAAIAFLVMLIGMFIMLSRLKALAQIVGLLVMENGIFLLAASTAGGMPFIVEMAIFLDVFVSVLILGLFVYRINELFTGIDVSQLTSLKG